MIDLQVILPASRAGYLFSQDVPALLRGVQGVLQLDGVCRICSELHVHWR